MKTLERSASCVACGTILDEPPIIRIESASLTRCGSCGSWTRFPRPSAQDQAEIHSGAEYFAHPYFKGRRKIKVKRPRRCCEVFARLNTVVDVRSLQGQRLLDIGCDTGSFLADAAECHKIVPIGLDVSLRAVQVARARNLQVHHGTIEDIPPEFAEFRVVTAIDVIEHVVNPEAFLCHIHKRMSTGGVLYLQTPNVHSSIYQVGWGICRLTGARPRAVFLRLFQPQHVQYFSRYGLTCLAKRSGFKVAKVETRILPPRDIVAHKIIRGLVMGLQYIDYFRENRTLICALLQKLP